MQMLCLLATSSEKQEPQWTECIDMQISLKVPWALTAAVSVPHLHAVLLLGDGVDPIVRLAAVPVVVVEGGAICPLKVTLLTRGQWRKASLHSCDCRGGLPWSPHPIPSATQPRDKGRVCPHSADSIPIPSATQPRVGRHHSANSTSGFYKLAKNIPTFCNILTRGSPEIKSKYIFLTPPPSSAFLFIFRSFSSIYKKFADMGLLSRCSPFFFLTY